MAEKLEPSESLMPKIRALIDPPSIEDVRGKGKKLVEKEAETVPWKSNHDHCDFCGEGGDLLCCDKCPCAFHLACCEPPVDPDNIPSGDWLCAKCRPGPTPCPNVIAPFDVLVKQCLRRNPTSFSLPPEYSFNTPLPGGRKKKKVGDGSRSSSTGVLIVPPSATAGNAPVVSSPCPLDNDPDYCEGDRSVRDFCFVCDKTKRIGSMVYCDFCALAFHLDCLNPPLTNVPSTLWMCPNHAEHHIPSFRQPLLSERCAAAEETSRRVDRQSVVLDFLDVAKREKSPVSTVAATSVTLPQRNAIEVPSAVKALYRQPLATSEKCTLNALCDAISASKARTASRVHRHRVAAFDGGDGGDGGDGDEGGEGGDGGNTAQGGDGCEWLTAPQRANVEEQDQWLESVVRLQYGTSGCSDLPALLRDSGSVPTTVAATTTIAASPTQLDSDGEQPMSDDEVVADSNTLSPLSSVSGSGAKEAVASVSCPVSAGGSPGSVFSASSGSAAPSSADRGNSSDGSCITALSSSGRDQVCRDSSSSAVASASSDTARAGTNSRGSFWPRRARGDLCDTLPGMLGFLNATGPRPPGGGQHGRSDELQRQKAFHNDHLGYALPAVDRLDSRLLHLLAAQRLQQIMAGKSTTADSGLASAGQHEDMSRPPSTTLDPPTLSTTSDSSADPGTCTCVVLKTGSKASTTSDASDVPVDRPVMLNKDELLSAKAVLCPVSTTGSPFPINHNCTNIGLGTDMDLSLRHYSPCLRLSHKHASLFFDEGQQQYELLSYSEFGVYVDGVLYGCDVSHMTSSPASDNVVSMDHVRSSLGHGPRTRRARQRVESARRRWRQPHSMRYLQDLLSYCAPTDHDPDAADCEVSVTRNGRERADSDSDDEAMFALNPTSATSAGSKELSPPNSLQLPGQLSRPPRSPSPAASGNMTPMDNFSSWVQRQESAVRSAGFWLPGEAEKCLPCCSCTIDGGSLAVSACVPGNWEGAAVLHHGSTVRFGCLRFVLSVAGKPGHDQLVKSLLSVLPVGNVAKAATTSASASASTSASTAMPGPPSS